VTALEFGSVCSGIEAASVAWGPLGWRAAWLSEIDPFACSVLAYRIPHAPNLGDMTALPDRIRAREVKAPDVLTGGTPCQAFSVAGRREGLADARGNLTMTFVEIADAIDDVRTADGDAECVVVWENVPGVLSSRDNAFGCFLGALAGSGCELQPAGGGRWTDAGCVYGPKRTIVWRTIDAQFFGLAQRRRRVFVVASSRNGFNPAGVLFEFDGVRRDTPPVREAQQSVAGTVTGGARKRSGFSYDDVPLTETRKTWPAHVACTLNAAFGSKQGLEDQHALGGNSLFVPDFQPLPFDTTQITSAANYSNPRAGDPCHPLAAGAHAPAIAFSCKDHGGDAGDVAPTLRAMGHGASHANAGGQVAVAFQSRGKDRVDVSVDCAYALLAGGGSGGRRHEMNIATPAGPAMAVRRLTPRECERLQGFEDDWTLIPVKVRKKITAERFAYLRATYPDLTATDALLLARDGPRYKAIGNSWAVPCARWVGQRIDAHLSELNEVKK
jgi:DNA (cytosine-5)-methyltransferase 1